MLPILAWLAGDALGPELVVRCFDLYRRKDWLEELARRAAEAAGEKDLWRAVLRWLEEPHTWPRLVQLLEASVPALVESLVAVLTRDRRLRGHSEEYLRDVAERAVDAAATYMLTEVDPRWGLAIAHSREMEAHSRQAERLEALAEGLGAVRALLEPKTVAADGHAGVLREQLAS